MNEELSDGASAAREDEERFVNAKKSEITIMASQEVRMKRTLEGLREEIKDAIRELRTLRAKASEEEHRVYQAKVAALPNRDLESFRSCNYTTRNAMIPEASGVYFLFNGAKNPVYVGKSRNMRRRVNNHPVTRETKITKVAWVLCCESQLSWEEALFIGLLRPPLNFEREHSQGLRKACKIETVDEQ